MKKNVLILFALACSALFTNVKAENTCYDVSETSVADFWFTHMYFGTCTDYVGSNSKLAGTTGRIDFNGGSSLNFTGIQVSKDGSYTMRLTYGIGWADAAGAILKIFVNDEFISNCTLYPIAPAETATMNISVDLVAGYDNLITLTQQKDWPTVLGLELLSETAVSKPAKDNNLSVTVADQSLNIRVLGEKTSQVEIYSSIGKLIEKNYFNGSFSKKLNKGVYLVTVNGESSKILVK